MASSLLCSDYLILFRRTHHQTSQKCECKVWLHISGKKIWRAVFLKGDGSLHQIAPWPWWKCLLIPAVPYGPGVDYCQVGWFGGPWKRMASSLLCSDCLILFCRTHHQTSQNCECRVWLHISGKKIWRAVFLKGDGSLHQNVPWPWLKCPLIPAGPYGSGVGYCQVGWFGGPWKRMW